MADRGRGGGRGRGRGDGPPGGRGRGDGPPGGRGRGDGPPGGRGRGDGGDRGGRGGRGGSRGDYGSSFRGDRGGGSRGDRGGGFRGDRGGGFRGDRGGSFRGDRGGGFRGGRGGSEPARVFGGTNVAQPDPAVEQLENQMIKGKLDAVSAATSTDILYPRRPAYGTAGKKIILHTNYFEMKGVTPDIVLYRYAVAFSPDEKMPKAKKHRLMEILLEKTPFAGNPIASDWAQIMVSPNKISLDQGRAEFSLVNYPEGGQPFPDESADETEEVTKARKKNTFKAMVLQLGTVSIQELLKDLCSPDFNYPLRLEAIQALNIIMTYGPSKDKSMTTVGGNKFYPFGSHPQVVSMNLGGGLEALRGYFTSVRTGVGRLLVNVNVATGAFYKGGPLVDIITAVGAHKAAAFVRRLKFETNYIPDRDNQGKVKMGKNGPLTKKKFHTIWNLSSHNKNALNTTFQVTDANGRVTQVSVADHFKRQYNITLKKPTELLVNYGNQTNQKWIPAELCTIIPGQAAKRLLQGQQTSAMITFAARRPYENAESITDHGLQVSKINPVGADGLNVNISMFGIKVNTGLVTVSGRILSAPDLHYRTKKTSPRNGAWNLDIRQLGAQPFQTAKSLGSWDVLVINSGKDAVIGGLPAIRANLNAFHAALGRYGLNPSPVPQQQAVVNISPNDLRNKDLKRIQKQISEALRTQLPAKPKFLFVLLPGDDAALYDAVKYFCDIEHGIPNICNIGTKWAREKGQDQYFANVAMKFNQKLGGVNHTVHPSSLSPLDAQTIVFGIDVTHPSPGSSDSAPSIAGVVASVDSMFSQYPASMRTQTGRQEMVDALDEMIVERIQLWQKRNGGRLPNKVIVYRDGVSEGQYRVVLEQEYPSFKNAFNKLYGAESKHPKISIIVVGKRHHTRFFPTSLGDTDGRTGNPQPGTVVDRGVTGEKIFDFFLQAHQGLQGTCKPAHYVVIKDDNRLGADQLQGLTHSLCYTFARATRSVSVCPPAYYADILCERGRSYLHNVLKGDADEAFGLGHWHKDVHQNLLETMYYL